MRVRTRVRPCRTRAHCCGRAAQLYTVHAALLLLAPPLVSPRPCCTVLIGNEMDMTLVNLEEVLLPATIMVVSVTGSTTNGACRPSSALMLRAPCGDTPPCTDAAACRGSGRSTTREAHATPRGTGNALDEGELRKVIDACNETIVIAQVKTPLQSQKIGFSL